MDKKQLLRYDREQQIQANEAKWIKENIKVRECNRFIVSADAGVCQCGMAREEHSKAAQTIHFDRAPWNPDVHSIEVKNNAFGEIGFISQKRSAKFLRVSHTCEAEKIENLLFQHWKLSPPGLIISVCGGMAQFKLDPAYSKRLRAALTKFAHSTGAWITTSGIRSGVAREIGKAVKQLPSSTADPIVCIAIASWSIVHDKDKLINANGCYGNDQARYEIPPNYKEVHNRLRSEGKPTAYLDPHHTHFLLVDNGTTGKHATELKFRSKLEAHIAKACKSKTNDTLGVPICCFFLGGSPSALENVLNAVCKGTPVIVAKGSGRIADILAEAVEYLEEKQVASTCEVEHKMQRNKLFDETTESHLRSRIARLLPNADEQEVKQSFRMLKACVRYRSLFTVVDQNCDLDRAILRSLLNSEKNSLKLQMQLSITWNCIDEARRILDAAQAGDCLKRVLADVAVSAIMSNRHEFLREFQQRALKLHSFLSVYALAKLYNAIPAENALHKLLAHRQDKNVINLSDVGYLINKMLGSHAGHPYVDDPRYRDVDYRLFPESTINDSLLNSPPVDDVETPVQMSDGRKRTAHASVTVEEIIQSCYADLMNASCRLKVTLKAGDNALPVEKTLPHFDDPALDLFSYSVLLNRLELAMIFFEKVTEPLGAALMAAVILKRIAEKVTDKDENALYWKNSSHFEKLAYDIMTELRISDQRNAKLLLVRPIPLLSSRTCLEIAREGDLVKFVSNECVRAYLDDAWHGKLSGQDSLKRTALIFMSCLVPPLLFTLQYQLDKQAARARRAHKTFTLAAPPAQSKRSGTLVNHTHLNHRQEVQQVQTNPDNQIQVQNQTDYELALRDNTCDSQAADAETTDCDENLDEQSFPSVCPRKFLKTRVVSRVLFFYTAPCVTFYYTLIAYITFLFILSYDILIEYNASDQPQHSVYTHWIELFLIAYVACYAAGEIHQMLTSHAGSLLFKLKQYLRDRWNQLDLFAIFCFILGIMLGNMDVAEDKLEGTRAAGRIIFALSVLAFFLKLLHWYFVFSLLGPKVYIVGGMLKELIAFLAILLLFVVSWGIAEYALLFPASKPRWSLFQDVLSLSYWQMFTNFYLNIIQQLPYDVDLNACTTDEELYSNFTLPRCPDKTGQWVVPIFLGVYIVITNVLLLSLLIAIFNQVIDSKETIYENWCFKKFELIVEFSANAPITPPFTLLYYGYRLARAMMHLIKPKKPAPTVELALRRSITAMTATNSIMNRKYSRLEFVKEATKKLDSILRRNIDIFEDERLRNWLVVVRDEYLAKKSSDNSPSLSRAVRPERAIVITQAIPAEKQTNNTPKAVQPIQPLTLSLQVPTLRSSFAQLPKNDLKQLSHAIAANKANSQLETLKLMARDLIVALKEAQIQKDGGLLDLTSPESKAAVMELLQTLQEASNSTIKMALSEYESRD